MLTRQIFWATSFRWFILLHHYIKIGCLYLFEFHSNSGYFLLIENYFLFQDNLIICIQWLSCQHVQNFMRALRLQACFVCRFGGYLHSIITGNMLKWSQHNHVMEFFIFENLSGYFSLCMPLMACSQWEIWSCTPDMHCKEYVMCWCYLWMALLIFHIILFTDIFAFISWKWYTRKRNLCQVIYKEGRWRILKLFNPSVISVMACKYSDW